MLLTPSLGIRQLSTPASSHDLFDVRQAGVKYEHARLQGPEENGIDQPAGKLILGSAHSQPVFRIFRIKACALLWCHATVGESLPTCADIIGHCGFGRVQSLNVVSARL